MISRRIWLLVTSLAYTAGLVGCDRADQSPPAVPTGKPNIIMIVWDTVRADRLSLYGYERNTTPHLEEFAEDARVFENCVSVGSTTVPSHAAMFTGLMPAEHRVNNQRAYLADQFETLAETLRTNGYRTYMFCENPLIYAGNNYAQGFDVVEHPWDPQYRDEALRITLRKHHPDATNEANVLEGLRRRGIKKHAIKAAGSLARKGIESWLGRTGDEQPFFVFLNYMEAHRPLIPPRKYRAAFMSPDDVRASYGVERRWISLWAYVFGVREFSPRTLRLINATYDAALLELDDLLHSLLESLRAAGRLDNTIVALVGDHGELLGEHHMLDHQYSVHEPLMRVPLVLYYPPAVRPGRDSRPVMNLDLYPTLLELAGIDPPVKSKAVSLLRPLEKRPRVGEYPRVMTAAFDDVAAVYPELDRSKWNRRLRAYYDEPYKFVQASNGTHELYHLGNDPGELHNLVDEQRPVAVRLLADLKAYVESLQVIVVEQPASQPVLDPEMREFLEAIGYKDDAQPTSQPASQPATQPVRGTKTSEPP